MSGFFKGMFSAAAEDVPQLAANTEAAQGIVVGNDNDAEMSGSLDEEQSEVRVNRPPGFLDNIYPRIPDRRDFSATKVWERSRVSDVEQENVKRAQQLLDGLPPETPDSVKRQIVETAFRAFKVSIEDIVSAASSEIDALRDYIADANARAARFQLASEERIGELEAEIERIRGTIVDAEDEREQLVGSALELIENVEPVLAFFGDRRNDAAVVAPLGTPLDTADSTDDDSDTTVVTSSTSSRPDANHETFDDAVEQLS